MSENQKPLVPPRVYEERLRGAYIDPHGREINDPTPVAPPAGISRELNLIEQIRLAVRSERMAEAARSRGLETFEESEDFDVDDDYDPSSPWENDFEPSLDELRQAVAEIRAKKETSNAPAPDGSVPAPAAPEAPKTPEAK